MRGAAIHALKTGKGENLAIVVKFLLKTASNSELSEVGLRTCLIDLTHAFLCHTHIQGWLKVGLQLLYIYIYNVNCNPTFGSPCMHTYDIYVIIL